MIQKERIQLSIVLGCVIQDNQVLMIRRREPQQPELHGYWEFPGGKIKFGENPATAVEREVLEETGIKVAARELLPFSYVAIRRRRKRRLNVIVFCYRCDPLNRVDNFVQSTKVAEKQWNSLYIIDPLKVQSGTLQFLLHVIDKENLLPNQTLVETSTQYLSLHSIDSRQNRYRAYNILVEARLHPSSPFRIQCQWGRMNQPRLQQASIEEFEDRDSALKYVNEVLAVRRNHGYKIVDGSSGFPVVSILSDFPIDDASIYAQQLRLF